MNIPEKIKTVDFGAPSDFGMHHFYVEIPQAPREAVSIHEDFGFDGDDGGRDITECDTNSFLYDTATNIRIYQAAHHFQHSIA